MARVGRPAERESAKLAPLNMRTSPQLRAQIEEAADKNGRSLTQEVERRLMTSFIFDEVRGGQHINAFANMLSSTIHRLEVRYGKRWVDDPETFAAVKAATFRLLDWDSPRIDPGAAYWEWQDAKARRIAAQVELAQFVEQTGAMSPLGALIAIGQGGKVNVPQGSEQERERVTELERQVSAALATEVAASDRFEIESSGLFQRVDAAEKVGASAAALTFEEVGPTRKADGS